MLVASYQLSGLQKLFSADEIKTLKGEEHEITEVLSYFATSLFDKNRIDDVLWDIAENCISQLKLEDCVIYMLDSSRKVLVQKAAYGNKNAGQRKVLNPIRIPMGKGIVGEVAATGKYLCLANVNADVRYIVDDEVRRSELAVPIIINNRVVGVLDSEHTEESYFTEKHIFIFLLITRLASKKLKQLQNEKVQHSVSISGENVYFKSVEKLMKEEKIFRDPNLGLDSVSQKLSISSNYLSQLINQCTGNNFSYYVNHFRVEDVKNKLKDPEFAGYTILHMGLESGFNSKTTFFKAFKKHTGVSPGEYQQDVKPAIEM